MLKKGPIANIKNRSLAGKTQHRLSTGNHHIIYNFKNILCNIRKNTVITQRLFIKKLWQMDVSWRTINLNQQDFSQTNSNVITIHTITSSIFKIIFKCFIINNNFSVASKIFKYKIILILFSFLLLFNVFWNFLMFFIIF